jgi:hypothetical protein
MSWVSTLTEMLVELRARGGYRRSATLTDAILTPFLNSGIAEVHDLVVRHAPDMLVMSSDLTTAANVATVALPARFYKGRRVDLVEGASSARLRSFELDEETYLDESTAWDAGTGSGRPRYMYQAGNLRLVPTPTSAMTIRVWYVPHATKLESPDDTYTGVNGFEDLVYEHALRLCKARERMDTTGHDSAIQRLEKRLLYALEARDQSEPEYLPDLSRGSW